MGLDNPSLLHSTVVHHRFIPKSNKFHYSVYYMACRVSQIEQLRRPLVFGVNGPGLLSFQYRDHGERDGSDLGKWICGQFADHGIETKPDDVLLVCLPRVLGYVFNPVSFWYALDSEDNSIKAVLCEVNNTFREHHWYVCLPPQGQRLGKKDWVGGDKLFHVSPFLEREGSYRFRFHAADERLGAWIDYYNTDGEKVLGTSVAGTLSEASVKEYLAAFFRYPLVTLKVIALIHWQALKLALKGIKYRTKPEQRMPSISRIDQVTKS